MCKIRYVCSSCQITNSIKEFVAVICYRILFLMDISGNALVYFGESWYIRTICLTIDMKLQLADGKINWKQRHTAGLALSKANKLLLSGSLKHTNVH